MDRHAYSSSFIPYYSIKLEQAKIGGRINDLKGNNSLDLIFSNDEDLHRILNLVNGHIRGLPVYKLLNIIYKPGKGMPIYR